MMPHAVQQTFASVLREILLNEQRRTLKDVAEEVGLSARNFYGRVTGRIQFTPDEINRVLRAVPEPRLADWLLDGTGLTCTRRISPSPHDPSVSAVDLALHSVEESMAALRSILQMRAPGTITPGALATAQAHVEQAQRQLAALQVNLRTGAAD